MIAKLPPLPPWPYAAGALRAWTLEALHCGFVQTGNGYFVFWAFAIAHEGAEVRGDHVLIDLPPWVTHALLDATLKLEKAGGVAEVAGAIGMRGKTSARDARQAHTWFDNAMNSAMVRDAIDTKGAKPGEALELVSAFLRHEGTAITSEALRKRLERLRPSRKDPLPADPFGRTDRK